MISEGLLGTLNRFVAYMHELNFITVIFRLLLAMVLGSLIGIDRGMKRRVAGVKTHTIVCIGAAIAMMTGQFIHLYSNGVGVGDTARLGAQVISGVGFLGAGTIMVTGHKQVLGLTTAASLWTCSCIGLAIGIGFYSGAIGGTLAVLIVLRYFKAIDIYVANNSHVFEVYMEFESKEMMGEVIRNLRNEDIKINNVVVVKQKTKSKSVVVQASVEAGKWMTKNAVFRALDEQQGVISVQEL
ncbi:MAG: MgtC/SapB family protein [Lachnospiraceae bacterium]|nr:MgtC/SapB family protein [Lachnospiraceae bacterium]